MGELLDTGSVFIEVSRTAAALCGGIAFTEFDLFHVAVILQKEAKFGLCPVHGDKPLTSLHISAIIEI